MTACSSWPQHRDLQHFGSGMRRNQNFEIFLNLFLVEKVTYIFRLLDFFNFFFCPSFFYFTFLLAAVIDLLLGLLAVKKTFKKTSSRQAIFTLEKPRAVAGSFALSFSLNLLSIFMHISGTISTAPVIWLDVSSQTAVY